MIKRRRHFKQETSFEDRLALFAKDARAGFTSPTWRDVPEGAAGRYGGPPQQIGQPARLDQNVGETACASQRSTVEGLCFHEARTHTTNRQIEW
jgi:hypothetical protein